MLATNRHCGHATSPTTSRDGGGAALTFGPKQHSNEQAKTTKNDINMGTNVKNNRASKKKHRVCVQISIVEAWCCRPRTTFQLVGHPLYNCLEEAPKEKKGSGAKKKVRGAKKKQVCHRPVFSTPRPGPEKTGQRQTGHIRTS